MQNEKIAEKVNNDKMDALDAGYLVVEESTAETTEDLVTRAIYIGAAMVAALLGIVAAVLALKGKNVRTLTIAAFALALAATVFGISRSFSAHPLQMAAIIALAAVMLLFMLAVSKKVENV